MMISDSAGSPSSTIGQCTVWRIGPSRACCWKDLTARYFVLKKSSFLPQYDESIMERGYDNVLYTEYIRYSSRCFGLR